MTDRSENPGFGESPQARFEPASFDLTDPGLLEVLDCVADEPGVSGGHPRTSLEGRRAQLAYVNACIAEGLQDIEDGNVVRGAEADAILLALSEGREPPKPVWLDEPSNR